MKVSYPRNTFGGGYMAIDPICGMEVAEQGAEHMLHFEHVTIYFCSESCKRSYAEKSGIVKPAPKTGVIARFLAKIALSNESSFGDGPPRCH